MDYICYVSRTKIDQLHALLDPTQVTEFTEQITSERTHAGDLGVGLSFGKIFNLFKGGVTYGRKNIIQRERKVKMAYTEKLRDVLLAIAADHGDIPDLKEAVSANHLDGVYYYYSGDFRAKPLADSPDPGTVCRIYSTAPPLTLTLDCSLRFFSENSDGYLVHSGNYMFFEGLIDLHLSGVLVLLGRQGNAIFGSPLYLQLTVPGGDYVHTAL